MTHPETRYFSYSLQLREPIRVGSSMMNKRDGFLVRMQNDGHVGWGEAAPLDGYGQDTLHEVSAALADGSSTPTLSFARDCAARNLRASQQGMTFADSLGECRRTCLHNTGLASSGKAVGKTVKWKVGNADPERDAKEINDFMASHPETILRPDANGRWDKAGALRFADLVSRWHDQIDFVEEPWEGCFERDNREEYPLRMAMDESLNESLNECDWRFADVIVLKPSLMGTLAKTMALASKIGETRRDVLFSSAFESSVGMGAIIAIASRYDGGAVGFGTYRYVSRDVGPRVAAFDREIICLSDFSEREITPEMSRLKELNAG